MEWFKDAFFYHVYPLGFCGAAERNTYQYSGNQFAKIEEHIQHMKELGVTALYLGPVFESVSHGYDTVDYFKSDSRLGTNEDLKNCIATLHSNGIRVILDGVFNHTGRDFFAFRDILTHGESSGYRDWYKNINFHARSPYNDNFSYEGWAGHYDLCKLNICHEPVKSHLFEAVRYWIDYFGIDGLRLDAADVLDLRFLSELSDFTRSLRHDFYLTGEVVHGDYSRWLHEGKLHSTTNYECYKGLYSSLNDVNYFEIAHSLKRQSGQGGLYKDAFLYNFTDNHDVNRVASDLKRKEHLYPLYGMLFTMPGIPSIYYGSEWGVTGKRNSSSDRELRPSIGELNGKTKDQNLFRAIRRFAEIRKNSNALRRGGYRELFVSSDVFAFERSYHGETICVVFNSSQSPKSCKLSQYQGRKGFDVLNENDADPANPVIHPNWLSVIQIG